MKTRLLIMVLVASLLISAQVLAQSTGVEHTISVTGEVTTPLTLKAADMKSLKHLEIKAKDNDGATHTYAGVPLIVILEKAGVTVGKQLRGENMAKFVLVKASDGYEVVFSLAEIDPEFTDRIILLADTQDGKPLPTGTGPYRMVVPGEKKHARWIREIASIQVLFAKE